MDFTGFEMTTERLLLRPFQESDFEKYAEMHADPAVARYLPWARARDEETSRRAFEKHASLTVTEEGDALTLAGVELETGAFVGQFMLFLRSVEHRGGALGYVLHPEQQGRGLATEGARAMLKVGFELLSLHRIVAGLDARNVGSAAVLSKLGMRREAHFVRNELLDGVWTDEMLYALLADEWASMPPSSDISWKTTAPASSSNSTGVKPPA